MQSTIGTTFKLTPRTETSYKPFLTVHDDDDDKLKINEIDLFGWVKAYNLLFFIKMKTTLFYNKLMMKSHKWNEKSISLHIYSEEFVPNWQKKK